MNHDQFTLLNSNGISKVSAANLTDLKLRTLLYGYTLDRDTHHVYVMGGEIHRLIFNTYTNVLKHASGSIDVLDLVPTKRLYPERCDFTFCHLLKGMGVYLPFTTFDHSWSQPIGQTFAGYTHEDLKSK